MRSLPFVERSELAGWGAVWTVVFIIATVVSFLGGAARDNGLPADRGGEPLFARCSHSVWACVYNAPQAS